jgi:hypothetical protein
MDQMIRPTVLVTGAPRSGTTFLGKMLAMQPSVLEVEEPFNVETGVEGMEQHFLYIRAKARKGSAAQRKYQPIIEDLLAGRAWYKQSALRPDTSNPIRRLARNTLVSRQNIAYRMYTNSPLKTSYVIKDPNACFISEYLDTHFPVQTVVIMRHPASTIASYKRLGWHYRLENFTSQRELMKDFLQPYLGPVKIDSLNAVEAWSYFWLCIYVVLEEFLARDENMTLITHEQLSTNPHATLNLLYNRFELEYSPEIAKEVDRYTSADNPVDPRNNVVHDLQRNSAEVIHRWKKILTPEEISTIRSITEPIARKHYKNSSWD